MDRRHWLTDEGEEAVKYNFYSFLETQTPFILQDWQLCNKCKMSVKLSQHLKKPI